MAKNFKFVVEKILKKSKIFRKTFGKIFEKIIAAPDFLTPLVDSQHFLILFGGVFQIVSTVTFEHRKKYLYTNRKNLKINKHFIRKNVQYGTCAEFFEPVVVLFFRSGDVTAQI